MQYIQGGDRMRQKEEMPHGAAEIAADLKEATGNGGFFRPALGKRASVWEPPPPQPRRLFSLVPRSTSLRCGPRLAVARSHSRSDMPPACHSLRSCRFATRSGEAHLDIRFCMNICLGEGFMLPSWMHARFGFPKQSLPAAGGGPQRKTIANTWSDWMTRLRW